MTATNNFKTEQYSTVFWLRNEYITTWVHIVLLNLLPLFSLCTPCILSLARGVSLGGIVALNGGGLLLFNSGNCLLIIDGLWNDNWHYDYYRFHNKWEYCLISTRVILFQYNYKCHMILDKPIKLIKIFVSHSLQGCTRNISSCKK